jgi:hypothetical protein
MRSHNRLLLVCGLAVTLLATSSPRLIAGELVQFQATSAVAGLKLLGYLAPPRGPQAGPSPAVLFSTTAAALMTSPCPGQID